MCQLLSERKLLSLKFISDALCLCLWPRFRCKNSHEFLVTVWNSQTAADWLEINEMQAL